MIAGQFPIDQEGIYALTAEQYHADPCLNPSLNFSTAKVICLESPAHAWAAHARLNPAYTRDEKECYDLGTSVHSVLLEGVDKVEVIDAADWRTKAAKEARDAARANGKIPLLPATHAKVLAMVAAVRGQLAEHDTDGGSAMFTGGEAEQSLIWRDGGTLCRARLDYIRRDRLTATTDGWCIDDYKTAADANPDNWIRQMFRLGYDLQAAWYQHGHQAITGELSTFRFCVQETEPPYALSVIGLNTDTWTLAEKKRLYAVEVWNRCVKTNRWPGYPPRTCFATLPPTHEAWWLEKEVR